MENLKPPLRANLRLGGYRHIGESLKMSDYFRLTSAGQLEKVRLKIQLKGNLFLARFLTSQYPVQHSGQERIHVSQVRVLKKT